MATSGPWTVVETDGPDGEERIGVDSAEHAICILDGPADANASNALLLAAAPQMLDELGYIIRGWRTIRNNQRALTPWEEERLALAEETFRLATGKD